MNHEENTYSASPMTEADQVNPTIALVVPGELPEKIIVNGVTYLRQNDWIDHGVNKIEAFKTIARRTGLTLKQAIWFTREAVMPD